MRAALLPILAALAAGCRQDARAEGFAEVEAIVPDAGVQEAVAAAPAPVAPPPAAPRAVRYPDDQLQSPITPAIAANLRAIAARGKENERVFAKFGDSITDSDAFMDCFAGNKVDLGDRGDLEDTLAWFRAGRAAGTSPYTRDSLAAITGWAARGPLGGRPSPLEREVTTVSPRYAVVMFGTNDVDYRRIDQFGSDLWTIVDDLIARGVIPLMSTIPPIDRRPEPAARVPLFNVVVRALAEGRQVPLVDLHRALAVLPDHGLRDDGVHPNVPSSLGACNFTAAGLRWGYDQRNLLTLDSLDRARHALAGDAPDQTAPARDGAGTAADPFAIDTLPFAHVGDTRAGESRVDHYACDPDHDESGPEIVYRLDLPSRTRIRARVVSRGDTDVDVNILSAGTCLARGNKNIATTVGPGPVDIVVDTYVDHRGTVHEGEYMLIVEDLAR
jgi:hypothetical protein